MAYAYAYADGKGPMPDELVILRSIDRYGVNAIYGRPLSFHEIRMMTLADSVVNAYREREKSDNWGAWTDMNPDKAELLAEAGKLAEDIDNG